MAGPGWTLVAEAADGRRILVEVGLKITIQSTPVNTRRLRSVIMMLLWSQRLLLRLKSCHLVFWALVAIVLLALPGRLAAQNPESLLAVDTSSPRATMRTFFSLAEALETKYLYAQAHQSSAAQADFERVGRKLLGLLDLSQVPPASHRSVGGSAFVFLLDVLRRVEVPALEAIPDEKAFTEPARLASWSVPGTEITITRIAEGERKGEFLFSAATVRRAPEFYGLVEGLPLQRTGQVASWRTVQLQLHGWMIPLQLVPNLPQSFKQPLLDTPIWKLLASFILVVLTASLILLWHRLTWPRRPGHSPAIYLCRLLTPLAMLAATIAVKYLLIDQIWVIGRFSEIVQFTSVLALYISAGWALWLAVFSVVEWSIATPAIPDESLDANLLRLLGRIIGIVGITTVVGYGAQQLGIPLFGVLAGLGVGGLAVALAAQGSIENLIGGLNIHADRPIRVGDFCECGPIKGHIEYIGLRSTRIRGVDRTITSIPNSQLAKATITNYALRDQMLLHKVLDLRQETTTDQLRLLVKNLRDYLSSHSKIRSDVAIPRVHVIGLGDWSIKVEVYAYVDTAALAEFLAVQEELMLRIVELVGQSGAGFAFPSQITYVTTDSIHPGGQQGSNKSEPEKTSAQMLLFPRVEEVKG